VLLLFSLSHDQSQPLGLLLAPFFELRLCELGLLLLGLLFLSFLVLTHNTVYKLIIPSDFLKNGTNSYGSD